MVETEQKKSIAAIGNDEFTLGFQLAGVNKIYNPDNYGERIQELIDRDDLGIVIARKEELDELPEKVRREVDQSVDPVVVALSEKAESERLNDKIRRVIGADIT